MFEPCTASGFAMHGRHMPGAMRMRAHVFLVMLCLAIAHCHASETAPGIAHYAGAGGYMLTQSNGKEIYANELASLQHINPTATITTEIAFATIAYWKVRTKVGRGSWSCVLVFVAVNARTFMPHN